MRRRRRRRRRGGRRRTYLLNARWRSAQTCMAFGMAPEGRMIVDILIQRMKNEWIEKAEERTSKGNENQEDEDAKE